MAEKKVKQKIEDAINELLDGDNLKNAHKFVAHLRENKMNPAWASTNSWKVAYKGKG